MRTTAILLAAGRGERFGADKIQVMLRGRPLWHYAYATLKSCSSVSDVGLVVSRGQEEVFGHWAPDAAFIIPGGDTRTESARRGVEASSGDHVLIHDAARPFVSAAVVERVAHALGEFEAVAACVPVVDTIKQVRDTEVVTLARDQLVAMQTPQGAKRATLLRAYDEVSQEFTDEMALLEAIGIHPHLVAGDPANFKVTTPDDLLRAASYLGAPEIRTGFGYDIHPFADDDRPMFLGGVRFEGRGLAGHSDADVLLHAVTDAVLGAVGLGDIGQHFPNDDPQWRGAPSGQFLAHAVSLVRAQGWDVLHLDMTLIAETPRIMVKAMEIRSAVAEIAGLTPDRVSVKATTNEQLGALGRGEGIAAFAVATLRQSP